MKVCIGSLGRFHTFDLACQIERLGHLQRLYTGYPKWKINNLGDEKVRSFPWIVGPMVLAGRLRCHGLQRTLERFATESFDRWMAARLEQCDVFHCLSGFGTLSHRVAKERYGALTVCDRGSSHIVYQDSILAEEHGRFGLPYRPIDRSIVERELWEYEHCDLIAIPSSFAYRTFVEQGVSKGKLIRIPYGVDLQLFRPAPKRDDVFRVIYVGALSLQKGIPYLLEAIAPLRLPRFEVWLVGALLPEARTFLDGARGSYRYLGSIPRTDLYRYYSQGSVFVLPSVQEGLALVQAQAMACGLPIIGTSHTGAEDLIKDGVEGFIVPIRSSAAIRDKILWLYEQPDLRDKMAAAALDCAQKLGGWDLYGERMVASYRTALGSH
jgi:glycosyltransferase involved in cell wall biosynthesis